MNGEMIRDAALAAGGLLVDKVGGPSVKPRYQPPGVWEAVAMPESSASRTSSEWRGSRRKPVHVLEAGRAASMGSSTPRLAVCTVRRGGPIRRFRPW